MAFTPLTPQQYTAARQKFSADQIVQFEQKRKADSGGNAKTPIPVNALRSFTGTPSSTMSGSTQAVGNVNAPSLPTMVVNTAKSLVSGTIESGKDIGAAISAPIVQSAFDKLNEIDRQGLSTIFSLRQQAKSQGKDTTHYDNLIKNYQLSNNQTVMDVFPALAKSNEQVIGDFASMGLELLSSGQLATGAAEKITATAAEKGVPLLSRAISGAKIGGMYGAGFGLTGGMQANESIPNLAESMAVGGVIGAGTGAATAGIFGKRPEPTDQQKINDLISPKSTVNQARLAESQGRLYKGQEPTLLRSGTADKIATSDKQLQSVLTIESKIPGAAKMDQPTLYSALKEKITTISTDLQPEMKKTPIKTETIQKINDDWAVLKKTQITEADASEEINVKKQQIQFEERLKKTNATSMDDLWKERISYDSSVPDNVKRANNRSPESLQNKKRIWLQNREIFNGAINDVQSGLGKTSQQAFSDMSSMYDAQQNIITNAKVQLKAQPSVLGKFLKSAQGRVIEGAVGTGALIEGTKKVFTGNW